MNGFLEKLSGFVQMAAKKGYKKINFFYQDESKIGLFPIKRRRITSRGVQPIAKVDYKREYFYIYGIVAPQTGESFFLELPGLNGENFQYFLKACSKEYEDSFNVLIGDNGTFHKGVKLKIPKNIYLEFLPPYSPELNPIERVWRDLKDRLSRKEVFDKLDHLSNEVCEIIREYYRYFSIIKSLTSYSYFLNSVALIYV